MKALKVTLISLIGIIFLAITVFFIHRNNPIHKAHVFEMKGEYSQAIVCLRDAIERNPNSANEWHELGNIYNITNKPKWALQCFQQYVILKPDDVAMAIWVKKYQKSLESKYRYSKAWVQILNATIGPSREDGTKWNGGGQIPAPLLDAVATLLIGPNPYNGILSKMASMALKPREEPAPYGVVEVAINGQFQDQLRVPIGNRNIHTYTPIFRMAEYKGVPLNDGTRFRIDLYNAHFLRVDPIGVAEINSNDIESAIESQKVYQVQVADQTQRQILFIGIEARPIN